MTFSDHATRLASTLWKRCGRLIPGSQNIAERIRLYPIPFGLSYEYGTLYGWCMHEKLHPPELETFAFFKKHIKEGEVVADIGANIGYYTLLFAKLVGPQGEVVAFEPSPKAFSRLQRATRGKVNVLVVHKGVFSSSQTLKLYSNRKGDPLGSFMYKRGPYVHEIPVIALREYDKNFNWAKIDVEGAEIEVLKGFKTPIRAVVEVARGLIENRGETLEIFFSNIEALGYRIHFIIENGDTTPYTGNNTDALRNNIFIEPLH